jgi:hypothetical protein
MSKMNRESLEQKLKGIEKGSYYFGIIGRLSLAMGFLGLLSYTVLISAEILQNPNYNLLEVLLSTPYNFVSYIIYGFVFLVARDAFDAIKILISEVNEIV